MEDKHKKHLAYRKRCEERPFRMFGITKKSWCKVHGVAYNLDEQYLQSIWSGECPVYNIKLNVPMKDAKGRGSHLASAAHLDRLDPRLGYMRGNVAWISGRANRIKYDASLEELKQLVDWMERATTIP